MEFLPTVADGSIHCVITDPPYGTTDCSWDKVIDMDAWFTQIERVTTLGAVIAIFCAQPFTTTLINTRPKLFRYDLVWDKVRPVGFLNANRQPMRVHEQVLIFCKRPSVSVYHPQFLPGRPYRSTGKTRGGGGGTVYRKCRAHTTINNGTRHPTSILQFAKPLNAERIHPTEKPIQLLNWLVRSYSKPGQTILDTFAGSAGTLAAAMAAGRNAVGVELDDDIIARSRERLAGHPCPPG